MLSSRTTTFARGRCLISGPRGGLSNDADEQPYALEGSLAGDLGGDQRPEFILVRRWAVGTRRSGCTDTTSVAPGPLNARTRGGVHHHPTDACPARPSAAATRWPWISPRTHTCRGVAETCLRPKRLSVSGERALSDAVRGPVPPRLEQGSVRYTLGPAD